MNTHRSWLATVALAAMTSTATAGTVVLEPSKDNTLYESVTGALSNGAGVRMFAGRTNTGLLRRALMAFDLSSIPPDSVITDVSLQLTMTRTVAGDTDAALHRVTADWGEGTSDASGLEGEGAASTTGDATWIHTSFSTGFWSSAGGDFVASSSATQTVGAVGTYTWSSSGMVSDVQAWYDTPSSNFGWVLLGDETGGNQTAKRFDTRERPVPENRPLLTVTFVSAGGNAVPTLSEWGMLAFLAVLTGAGIVALRKPRPATGLAG